MYIYDGHLGSLYVSSYELSYEEEYCEQCGDSDWLIGYATTGEEAWNLLKYDTDINGSGGWAYDYVREFILNNWDFDIDNYNDDFNPCYEDEIIKFVWGVKSYDDLTDSDANLYTMNDIDLIYLKEKNKYILGIETIYLFDKEENKFDYLKQCLDEFTKFMQENGYDISKKPFWTNIFNFNINSEFDSIEDCYAMFKLLVNGYCS